MTRRLESAHHPLAQSRWLMRILSAVILPLLPAVLDTGHDLSSRRAVALELICDDYSGYVFQPLQELAKELLRCFFISAALDQDVQNVAILIHCSPQIMNAPVNLEKHLIEVPPVAWSRTTMTQVVGISLTELEAPFSDSLIGNLGRNIE